MSKPDVIMAVMKLSRSMRRRPMHRGPGGAAGFDVPGGGHILRVLAENENVSSRELAELLDIRPSSLTELLSRMEGAGLIARVTDENDKRVSRIVLTEKGHEIEARISDEHSKNLEKFAACFTDEEAEQFCEMCGRLSAHLESLAGEDRQCECHRPGGFPHHRCGEGRGHRHCGGHPPFEGGFFPKDVPGRGFPDDFLGDEFRGPQPFGSEE